MNTKDLEAKRYQDAKDRERLDDLTTVTPFKDFGEPSPPNKAKPERELREEQCMKQEKQVWRSGKAYPVAPSYQTPTEKILSKAPSGIGREGKLELPSVADYTEEQLAEEWTENPPSAKAAKHAREIADSSNKAKPEHSPRKARGQTYKEFRDIMAIKAHADKLAEALKYATNYLTGPGAFAALRKAEAALASYEAATRGDQ